MFFSQAKALYRERYKTFEESFRIRIHRSLTWLEMSSRYMHTEDPRRAAQQKVSKRKPPESLDIRFIGLWIAFNSAYGNEIIRTTDQSGGDRYNFISFLQRICRLDTDGSLQSILWDKFAGVFRIFFDNKYCYQPFWNHLRGNAPGDAWLEGFEKSKEKLMSALTGRDTEQVLRMVFDRLYTIRNQILHGGSSCGSRLNRKTLRNGCAIMENLLPQILIIMMNNSDADWGNLYYPVIKEGSGPAY